MPRQTNFVTMTDMKLLQDPDKIEMPFRLIYRVLFFSALRVRELLDTKVSQLKKIEGKYYLELPTQKNKTKAELAPLREQDYYALREWIEMKKYDANDFIFQGHPGKSFSTQWINTILERHRKIVHIPYRLSSHAFRRGRVVDLKQKGFDYAEIKTLTRHKSLDVLIDTYDKKSKDVASKLVEE
jgi:integrase